jgi:hypothetical protein
MDIDGNPWLLITQNHEWRELERDQPCVTIDSIIDKCPSNMDLYF